MGLSNTPTSADDGPAAMMTTPEQQDAMPPLSSSLEPPPADAPADAEHLPPPLWKAVRQSPDQITAMLSEFTADYNNVVISLVLVILKASSQEEFSGWMDSLVSSALIGGMIVGQLSAGALGDLMGRWKALFCVICLQVVGSIGSALLTVPNDSVLVQLAGWRFFLGVGAGGVYPLAAVLSAEQRRQDHLHGSPEEVLLWTTHRHQLVALVFSMQGVGFVMASLVPWLLLGILGRHSLQAVWRLTLLLGAVPGIVVLYRRWNASSLATTTAATLVTTTDDDDEEDDGAAGADTTTPPPPPLLEEAPPSSSSSDLWAHIRAEPHLGYKLAATALTWFLFDVLFYGNTLFTPEVIQAAFGHKKHSEVESYDDLLRSAGESTLLKVIALPGYFVTIAVLGRRASCGGRVMFTPHFIQMQGFFCMTLLFATIGASWDGLKRAPVLLLLLYGGCFFFSNFGPNTTTYILPSILYSSSCRSTLNGLSAAAGKVGALLGASLFEPAANAWGPSLVLLLCALCSSAAFFVTRAAFGTRNLYTPSPPFTVERTPTASSSLASQEEDDDHDHDDPSPVRSGQLA